MGKCAAMIVYVALLFASSDWDHAIMLLMYCDVFVARYSTVVPYLAFTLTLSDCPVALVVVCTVDG